MQGKISDMDIQRLAIEAGEHFTLDEVREMIDAADEDGDCLSLSLCCPRFLCRDNFV